MYLQDLEFKRYESIYGTELPSYPCLTATYLFSPDSTSGTFFCILQIDLLMHKQRNAYFLQ